jgi:hypothetical protein
LPGAEGLKQLSVCAAQS